MENKLRMNPHIKPVPVGPGEYAYSRTAAVADASGRVQRRGGGSGNQKRADHARRKLAEQWKQTQRSGVTD